MIFQERFAYGFAPETGKKADIMFAQHMIACLNSKGKMATVLLHGVLFRGGDEKKIRKGMLKDNIVEAIIGLPIGALNFFLHSWFLMLFFCEILFNRIYFLVL